MESTRERNEKLYDYSQSIPPYLLEHIVKPAIKEGKQVVILAEEWQTAGVVSRINDLLSAHKLRDKVIIFWNANNIFGFERINFKQLTKACTITTLAAT